METENWKKRARKALEIVEEHYERENHTRCYKAVWKKYVNHIYPMTYHTMLGYVRMRRKGLI
jgi:hypothetical protein